METPEKKSKRTMTDIFIFVFFFIFFIIACSADAHPHYASAKYNSTKPFLATMSYNDLPLSDERINYRYVRSGTKIVIAYYHTGSAPNGTIALSPNYINPFNWLGVATGFI